MLLVFYLGGGIEQNRMEFFIRKADDESRGEMKREVKRDTRIKEKLVSANISTNFRVWPRCCPFQK